MLELNLISLSVFLNTSNISPKSMVSLFFTNGFGHSLMAFLLCKIFLKTTISQASILLIEYLLSQGWEKKTIC